MPFLPISFHIWHSEFILCLIAIPLVFKNVMMMISPSSVGDNFIMGAGLCFPGSWCYLVRNALGSLGVWIAAIRRSHRKSVTSTFGIHSHSFFHWLNPTWYRALMDAEGNHDTGIHHTHLFFGAVDTHCCTILVRLLIVCWWHNPTRSDSREKNNAASENPSAAISKAISYLRTRRCPCAQTGLILDWHLTLLFASKQQMWQSQVETEHYSKPLIWAMCLYVVTKPRCCFRLKKHQCLEEGI